MRVLHILGDSAFGGGSRIVLRLCERLKANGHQPAVLTTDPTFIHHCNDLEIPVVQLNCICRPIHPWKDWTGERRLAKYLKENPVDLVHTHTSKAGILGRRAAWRAKVPAIIHTVHGFAFHENSSQATIRLYAGIEKMAAKWCHRIITVSQFHRDWAEELGIAKPPKILAIPNGITPHQPISTDHKNQLRQEFGSKPDQVMIVSAGRLASGKGLEELLHSLADLPDDIRNKLHCVLPGTGPREDFLKSLLSKLHLEETVCMPGFRKDVRDILGAADLAVLPTHREGLSIALLEAMSAGLPVITTTIGSNLEVTQKGKAARLHSPGDTNELTKILRELAIDQKQRESLGKISLETYLQSYSEDRMLSAYGDLYSELSPQETKRENEDNV